MNQCPLGARRFNTSLFKIYFFRSEYLLLIFLLQKAESILIVKSLLEILHIVAGRRSLGTLRRRWKDNIRMDLEKIDVIAKR